MDIKEVTTSQQICQSDLEPFNHLLAPGINNTSDVSKADKLMQAETSTSSISSKNNKPGTSEASIKKSDLFKTDNKHSAHKDNESFSTIEGISNKPEIRKSERLQKHPKISYNEDSCEYIYNLNSLLISAGTVTIKFFNPNQFQLMVDRHNFDLKFCLDQPEFKLIRIHQD